MDKLKLIPESFQQLTGLRSFSLQSKRVKRAPEHVVGAMVRLKSLSLSCRSIQSLPDAMCSLPLSSLSILSSPVITSLPENPGALVLLETLKLCNLPNLQYLPESVGDLQRLRSLEISQLGLLQLPEKLCTGSVRHSLEGLYLRDCSGLRQLPPQLAMLTRLEELEITSCSRLESLEPLLAPDYAAGNVIYINGRPFVLREVERPFTNLEYTGINRARVEQMEARLKKDVLREAGRYSNKIMVSDELPDGQMVDQWEPVGPDSVQTPLEVYQDLQRQGYNVDYERVPVTDEKVPEEVDFDLLVESLSGVDEGTAQIFNCQMGRGRTTTGTVVATLICLARRFPSRIMSPSAGASMLAKAASTAGHEPGGAAKLMLATPGKAHGGVEGAAAAEAAEVQAEVDRVLLAGQYAVIRSLTRVLEAGSESKRLTDLAIDHCASMQNLREAILGYRNRIHRHSDEKRRQAALNLFVAYLERYYMLVCFSAFLHSLTAPHASTPSSITTSQALPSPSPSLSHGKADDPPSAHVRAQEAHTRGQEPHTPGRERFSLLDGLAATQALRDAKGGFQRWMKARPELYSILRRLLRRDPMGALGYAHPKQASMPRALSFSLPNAVSSSPTRDAATAVAALHAPAPTGAASLPAVAAAGQGTAGQGEGMEVEGGEVEAGDVAGEAFRMAEMAAAIVEARSGAMLSKQVRSGAMLSKQVRSGAMYGVCGLRGQGIDRQRVERMEARLKGDVEREAQRSGGMVVVDHESDAGELFHALEPVPAAAQGAHGACVQTPLEVFRMLQREGFRVDYHRLPTTDGQPPKSRDFDALATTISSAGPHSAFVFNCQMGRGRTTTGTVIASLVLLRCIYGRPLRLPSLPPSLALPSHSHPCTSQPSPPRCSPRSGSSSGSQDSDDSISGGGSNDENAGGRNSDASSRDANEGDGSGAMNPDLQGPKAAEPHSAWRQEDGPTAHRTPSSLRKCSSGQRKRRATGDAGVGVGGESVERRRSGSGNGRGGGGGRTHEGEGEGRGGGRGRGKEQKAWGDEFELEDIPVVRKVTRMLDGGAAARHVLDGVVDRCAQMLNIREAILSYRRAFNMQDADARTRQSALSRGAEFLERYVMLIAFASYLSSPLFRPAAPSLWPRSSSSSSTSLPSIPPSSSHTALPRLCPSLPAATSSTSGEAAGSDAGEGGAEKERGEKQGGGLSAQGQAEANGEGEGGEGEGEAVSFKAWLKRRPEIRQMKWGLRLRPARLFTIPEVGVRLRDSDASASGAAGAVEEREAEDAVLRARRGAVLGRGSILKLSLFPGLQPSALNYSIQIPHVPNYFEAPGYPVHSMATPTVQGAQAVLAHLGAVPQPTPPAATTTGGSTGEADGKAEGRGEADGKGEERGEADGKGEERGEAEVVIVDLREEAVVYVHGKPFVLRDAHQPAAALKHVGIAGSAVAAMEERLKADILQEAARCGGMVLLHKERPREGHVQAGSKGAVDGADGAADSGALESGSASAAAAAAGVTDVSAAADGGAAALPSAADDTAGAQRTAGSTAAEPPASGAAVAVGPTEIIGVWRAVGRDDVKTPAEVYRELREQQGYLVDYRRIPLTRERVLVASPSLQLYVQHRGPNVKFLFVSHTGYGAIAYAMALTCLHLQATTLPSPAPHAPAAAPSSPTAAAASSPTLAKQSTASFSIPVPKAVGGAGGKGEYRNVLQLERVLVKGPHCKRLVDAVAHRLLAVGRIVEDAVEYRRAVEAVQGDDTVDRDRRAALTDMGLKALRRYCYLIAYRSYLFSRASASGAASSKGKAVVEAGGAKGVAGGSGESFGAWVAQRPEIEHMLQHLVLE
ncbi:unnamed protein product [Closterium sp. Naga37s-1]|nr:unnamed protein product [Closterium sp. Naga37s-1]